MRSTIPVLALYFLATLFAGAAAPGSARAPIDVFLFAGQSNMGAADAFIPDPPGFVSTEADRAALFTCAPAKDGTRSPQYYPWGEIKGHVGKFGKLSHGPEVGFARSLHDAGFRAIAIVKVFGNYPLDVAAWPWREGGELFTPWMAFVDDRLAELRQRGLEPRVRGFVWHQGINDANHGKLAARYQENLTALIAALRRRFDAADAPFVLARSVNSRMALRRNGAGPGDPMAVVRSAQVAIGETVPRAAWISVDDLPNIETHHFSAENHVIIGRRFGDAYVKLATASQSRP